MTHPLQPPPATIRTEVMVPLRFSDGFATTARVLTFDGLVDGREHLAVGLGDRTSRLAPADRLDRPPLVRLHSECLTGDVFGSQRCDCGPQLREAVERIARGRRVPALPAPGGARHRALRQARRLRAAGRRPRHLRGERRARVQRRRARLHGGGPDGAALGVGSLALLSNNPDKAAQLARLGRRPSPRWCRPGCTSTTPTRATSRPRPPAAPTPSASAPEDPTLADLPPHMRGPADRCWGGGSATSRVASTDEVPRLADAACVRSACRGTSSVDGCLSGGGRSGRAP